MCACLFWWPGVLAICYGWTSEKLLVDQTTHRAVSQARRFQAWFLVDSSMLHDPTWRRSEQCIHRLQKRVQTVMGLHTPGVCRIPSLSAFDCGRSSKGVGLSPTTTWLPPPLRGNTNNDTKTSKLPTEASIAHLAILLLSTKKAAEDSTSEAECSEDADGVDLTSIAKLPPVATATKCGRRLPHI